MYKVSQNNTMKSVLTCWIFLSNVFFLLCRLVLWREPEAIVALQSINLDVCVIMIKLVERLEPKHLDH